MRLSFFMSKGQKEKILKHILLLILKHYMMISSTGVLINRRIIDGDR